MKNQRRRQAPPKPRRSPLMFILPAALLGAILLAALLFRQGQAPAAPAAAGLPREISVAEAAKKREAGAFMLDVRQPDEWEAVHIPGATLIPLDQLEGRLSEVPKDQEVVVVCRSGNRSATGRDILLRAGYTRVTSMAGGMNDWQNQGLETASGQ